MRKGFGISAILLSLALAWTSTGAGQEAAPPKETGVRITFLPPPMEGTLSMGVYDKKGKLVRVLAKEATEKDFTIGLNGLITSWDGKDDTGRPVPPATYQVRGYSVGALEVEGVALHGNDFITDDDAPRPVRVMGLRAKSPDEVAVELKTLDGQAFDSLIQFKGLTPAPETKDEAAKGLSVTPDGEVTGDGESRRLPLAEGEKVVDSTSGGPNRLWTIVRTATGREVRAYTLSGEFFRRLAYAPTEPQPQRILAARGTFADRWSEQIVLLEESDTTQRVRSLALPQKPATGEAPVWETVLEKEIRKTPTFERAKDLLQPEGKPFTPEKEFVVRLVNNPLIKDEPTTAHVTVGFSDRGSFLQTTDGLPLRRVTETPHLQWAVIGRTGSGKLLTVFQSEGTVVEEFRVKKLASMMVFDAGDYEWTGK